MKNKSKSSSRKDGKSKNRPKENSVRSYVDMLVGLAARDNSLVEQANVMVVDAKKVSDENLHPLLREGRIRNGEIWIDGNTSLLNLNLSHNKMTDLGLGKLHTAMKYQQEKRKRSMSQEQQIQSEASGGLSCSRSVSGLQRLSIEKNLTSNKQIR